MFNQEFMMDQLLHDFSADLQGHQRAVCLSLYQPTHRAMSGRQQDALHPVRPA